MARRCAPRNDNALPGRNKTTLIVGILRCVTTCTAHSPLVWTAKMVCETCWDSKCSYKGGAQNHRNGDARL